MNDIIWVGTIGGINVRLCQVAEDNLVVEQYYPFFNPNTDANVGGAWGTCEDDIALRTLIHTTLFFASKAKKAERNNRT